MKLWLPNRRQWFVIWAVYALVVLSSVDWDYLAAGYAPMEAETFLVLVVIAGALIVWRMQGGRQE